MNLNAPALLPLVRTLATILGAAQANACNPASRSTRCRAGAGGASDQMARMMQAATPEETPDECAYDRVAQGRRVGARALDSI